MLLNDSPINGQPLDGYNNLAFVWRDDTLYAGTGLTDSIFATRPLRTRTQSEATGPLTDGSIRTRIDQNTFSDVVTLYSDGMFHDWTAFATATVTLVDSFIVPAAGTVYTKVLDNLLVLTDALSKTLTLNRTQSEAILLSDNTLKFRLRSLQTSDGLTLLDALLQFTLRGRILSDTLVLLDNFIKQVISGKINAVTLSDGILLTDNTQKFLRLTRAQLEALVLSDGLLLPRLRTILMSDGLTLTDGLLRGLLHLKSLGDGVFLTDSFAKVVVGSIKFKQLDDALTLYSQGAFRDWAANKADAIPSLTDVMTPNVLTHFLVRKLSDALVLVDTKTLARPRVLIVSDALVLGDKDVDLKSYVLDVADTLALTDSQVNTRRLVHALSDAIVLADDFAKVLTAGGSVYTKVLDNFIVFSDGVQKYALLRRLLSDSAGPLTDSAQIIFNKIKALVFGDSLALSDFAFKLRTKILDEPIVITDVSQSWQLRGRVLGDFLAQLVDSYNANRISPQPGINFIDMVDTLSYADGVLRVSLLQHALSDLLTLSDDEQASVLQGLVYDIHVLVGVDRGATLAVDVLSMLGIDNPPVQLGAYA